MSGDVIHEAANIEVCVPNKAFALFHDVFMMISATPINLPARTGMCIGVGNAMALDYLPLAGTDGPRLARRD